MLCDIYSYYCMATLVAEPLTHQSKRCMSSHQEVRAPIPHEIIFYKTQSSTFNVKLSKARLHFEWYSILAYVGECCLCPCIAQVHLRAVIETLAPQQCGSHRCRQWQGSGRAFAAHIDFSCCICTYALMHTNIHTSTPIRTFPSINSPSLPHMQS